MGEVLWGKLLQLGNSRLEVSCVPAVDHCSMFERAYCDDVTLYEWLLSHRSPPKAVRAHLAARLLLAQYRRTSLALPGQALAEGRYYQTASRRFPCAQKK